MKKICPSAEILVTQLLKEKFWNTTKGWKNTCGNLGTVPSQFKQMKS